MAFNWDYDKLYLELWSPYILVQINNCIIHFLWTPILLKNTKSFINQYPTNKEALL